MFTAFGSVYKRNARFHHRRLGIEKAKKKVKIKLYLSEMTPSTHFSSSLLSILDVYCFGKKKSSQADLKTHVEAKKGDASTALCGCWCDAKLYFDVAAITGLNKVNMQTVINSLAGLKKSEREMQSALLIGNEVLIISLHQS